MRLEAMASTVAKSVKPYVPHPPSPTQAEFLALDCEEAGFGGAAGGGKSDALLMAALQFVDVPGYTAGIFRLAHEDWAKPDSVLQRAHAWFSGTDAGWDASGKSYVFPSGALIHFGSGMNGNAEAFKRAYQGLAFQFIGFDELTLWPERLYRWLLGSRLRRLTAAGVPLRARSTFNPGGPGHAWVQERFIENARHVATKRTLREDLTARRSGVPLVRPAVYESPASPEAEELARELGGRAQGAFFIPSFPTDNPGLDVPAYRRKLVLLDPQEREFLEWGNWWAALAGQLFRAEWWQFLEAAPKGLRKMRSWDMAGTEKKPTNDPAWTAGELLGIWPDPGEPSHMRIVWEDLVHFREEPGATMDRIIATAKLDGPRVPIVIEQEPGSAGKAVIVTVSRRLLGYNVIGFPKTGPKEEYWKLPSAILSNGDLSMVRAVWNKKAIDELKNLPGAGKKDIADALAQGCHFFTGPNWAALRLRALAQL
jgi:phage terminase large subunit-like protein